MRISLLGDTHSNWPWAVREIEHAKADGADVIYQLGDTWFTQPYMSRFIKAINKVLKDLDLEWYCHLGNHDDYDEDDIMPVNSNTGWKDYTDRIHVAPRGHRWTWDGVDFMSVGGAYSIDKEYRYPHESWWPQETITAGDVIRASREGNVDIMLTHDVPLGVQTCYGPHTGGGNKDMWPESTANRTALRAIVDAVQPDQLYHGHCHHSYNEDLVLDNGHKVQVTGLNRDTLPGSYLLLEI